MLYYNELGAPSYPGMHSGGSRTPFVGIRVRRVELGHGLEKLVRPKARCPFKTIKMGRLSENELNCDHNDENDDARSLLGKAEGLLFFEVKGKFFLFVIFRVFIKDWVIAEKIVWVST